MCNVNDDCEGNQRGDTCENNKCVKSCTSNDECDRRGRDGVCYNNRCFLSCASDNECRWGKGGRKRGVCDTDNSRCVMCNVDDDCSNNPRGDTCEDNRCV